MTGVAEEVSMTTENSVKTVFLVLCLTGIFIVVGNVAGGRGGAMIAPVLSLAINLRSMRFV